MSLPILLLLLLLYLRIATVLVLVLVHTLVAICLPTQSTKITAPLANFSHSLSHSCFHLSRRYEEMRLAIQQKYKLEGEIDT